MLAFEDNFKTLNGKQRFSHESHSKTFLGSSYFTFNEFSFTRKKFWQETWGFHFNQFLFFLRWNWSCMMSKTHLGDITLIISAILLIFLLSTYLFHQNWNNFERKHQCCKKTLWTFQSSFKMSRLGVLPITNLLSILLDYSFPSIFFLRNFIKS